MSVAQLNQAAGSRDLARRYLDEFPFAGPDRIVGRYLRSFWHPVAEAKGLPVGKARPVTLMNERFTLYRGASGTPYLVDHHCPHRGTQLSVGFVEGEEIRCLYHGWKFAGADGRCTERPGEKGKAGGGIRTGAYPTREFMGLIYAFIGEGEAPAFPPYPAFEGEGLIETYATHLPVNWFQSWENDWDPYHARFTHGTGGLHEIDYDRALATERNEETGYGVVRTMAVEEGTNTAIMMMPATVQLLIPTFNGQAHAEAGPQVRRTYLIHVPYDDHSHIAYITQLVPLAPHEQADYRAHYAAQQAAVAAAPKATEVAAEILRTGIRTIREVADHPMLVEVEDSLAQGGQGAIADRHAEHLGRTDAGLVMLRRLLARELDLMERGLPTKAWEPCPLIPIAGAYGRAA